ncbi:MAG: hypothetical protein HZB38_16635 [Planctomycetes bacterium]|nr:hypothetical protein [Planctomycetota bacterium]
MPSSQVGTIVNQPLVPETGWLVQELVPVMRTCASRGLVTVGTVQGCEPSFGVLLAIVVQSVAPEN